MNSEEQLRKTNELGLCSCSEEAIADCNTNAMESEAMNKSTDEAWRLQWRLKHSQRQTGKLWELLGEHLDETTQVDILEKLGRNCADNLGWAQQYRGNPEGFFQHMYKHSGEIIQYDKDAGIITVTTRERDCDCCLIDSKHISPIYCACSVGWQKYTYEIILGKKVEVQVKESVLRGSKRCVFIVSILEESPLNVS